MAGLIIDQFFHLIFIYLLWKYSDFSANPVLSHLITSIPDFLNLPPEAYQKLTSIISIDRIIILLIAYLSVTCGGAVITKLFIKSLYPDRVNQDSRKNFGKYIGMFERFITVILVQNEAMTAVAMVLTAKSIARHQQLNDKDFAEYYLIGTMFSIILALLGGIVLRSVLPLFS